MIDKEDIKWLITTILMLYFEVKRSHKKKKPSKRPKSTKTKKRK